MTVSGISSSSDLQQAWLAKMQQRKQDMSQLGSALQNGDLSGAQQAFADLQSLRASGGQNGSGDTTSGSGASSTNSANNVDASQLVSMLQGGDLASMLLSSGSSDSAGGSSSGSDLLSQLSQGGDLASMLMATGNSGTNGSSSSSDLFAALLGQTQPSSSAGAGVTGTQSADSTAQGNAQGLQDRRQQREQDFNQLGAALQSGDLASAQKAFAALQSLKPGGQSDNNSGSTVSGASAMSSDFANLGQALSAGNLTDAQDAFTKIQQDMQAHRGGHHHHHAAASYANVSSQGQDSSTSGTSSDSSSGINISV